MAVVLMAERQTSNLIGWHIKELMARKHIATQDRAADLITDGGYPLTQPALSKIISGRTEPSRAFSRALSVGFNLDAEERREWADMFALGETSTRPLSEESYEQIKAVRERVRQQEGAPDGGLGGDGAGGVRDNRA